MVEPILPKATEGLMTADHSKRGHRFVTVLNPRSAHVTLLEPWEHAVLVLCDGETDLHLIAEMLDGLFDDEPVGYAAVERCVKFFEREELIEELGLRRSNDHPPGPRTLAGLQLAYREWHKDPAKTGQILTGAYPAPDPVAAQLPVSLQPTVALPEEDEKPNATPVAVGTTLVLGDSEESFQDKRAMRSLLEEGEIEGEGEGEGEGLELLTSEAYDEVPDTREIFVPSKGVASVPEDEFEEELSLNDNVAALLAAVDDDIQREDEARGMQMEEPIAGEAVLPRARTIPKPATMVFMEAPPPRLETDEQGLPLVKPRPKVPRPMVPTQPIVDAHQHDEPTMRSIRYPEAALNPTMVGVPSGDGTPRIISPTRTPSGSPKNVERVGAVVAPTPEDDESNVLQNPVEEEVPTLDRPVSQIRPGATIQEAQTETRAPIDPLATTEVREDDGPTATAGIEHIALGRAREVFEILRRAGLKARSYSEDDFDEEESGDHPARRRHGEGSRRFEEAIASLTAGDLEVARLHFGELLEQMPHSERLQTFVNAIDWVNGDDGNGGHGQMLTSFEMALAEAVDYGRCPKCFSMIDVDERTCQACGFDGSRSPADA